MLHRTLAGLLAAAVRRWPEPLQPEVAREWSAELHELRAEAGVPAAVRGWRQLRFAASLATARPPGAPALAWLPRPGAETLWLLGAPLVSLLGTWALLLLPEALARRGAVPPAVLLPAEYLTLAAVAGLLGVRLARRPVRSGDGRRAGPVPAALPVVGGLLALDLLARQTWDDGWPVLAAGSWLLASLASSAWAAGALSRLGRHRLAWVAAALVTPPLTLSSVLALAAAHGSAAQLLRAGSMLELLGRPSFGLTSAVSAQPAILPAVLASVVLVLAYAIGLAGAPARLRPAAVSASPAVARSLWWHRILLGGAVGSLLAWAVTLAYLTPNIGRQRSPSSGWPGWAWGGGRLWMQELQLLGLACAVLCFLLALAHLGRPLLPTLAAGAALLATNLTVVRQDWATPALLPWLLAGGLLLGAAAWSVSIRLGPPPEHRSRRLILVVALLPLFLLPYPFHAHAYTLDRHLPPVLMLVVVGLPTVLATLTAMGVRAATGSRSHGWQFPALTAAAVTLCYRPGLVPQPASLDFPISHLPLVLALPAMVWTAAAIRGGALTRRRLTRHLLLAPALLAAGLLAAWVTVAAAELVGAFALFPMQYASGASEAGSGSAYLPGALLVGLVCAAAVADRLERTRPPSGWHRAV